MIIDVLGAPTGKTATVPAAEPDRDAVLNSECPCTSLDPKTLEHALDLELGRPGLFQLIMERCPHLFSAQPVFVSTAHLERMAQIVRAIESVVATPAYQEAVLSWAPSIARFDPGAKGVFLGYDFHVAQERLGLIEVNTNAGGAMLNAALARAQRACCGEMQHFLPTPQAVAALEDRIAAMFLNEWRLSGRTQALRTVAIVDESPQRQYLYPEFLLFQRLFERRGWRAVIADPAELSLRSGILWHGSTAIDLVYNRLTDFALEASGNAALRDAYLQRAVVLTPHPRAHALCADKRNLTVLSSAEQLSALGVPENTRRILLAHIPRTERVNQAQADRLWRERRGLFFKPSAGFGSRAAYRGDKITKRVWQDILAGDYIAQQFVAAGERIAAGPPCIAPETHAAANGPKLKFDVRNYVYDGNVQWTAARLYQGQTTNFRTPGGGFAAIYSAGPFAAADIPQAPTHSEIPIVDPESR
jgi:hypothetical protein